MQLQRTRGFTLIELLIVVAIIAILAAIAVPNFLEAQTRAKVSRAKADMRSVTTAIESYLIDYNQYSPPWDTGHSGTYTWGTIAEPPFHSRIGNILTTPIAYMTSLPFDPFSVGVDETQAGFVSAANFGDEGAMNINRRFPYWNIEYFFDGGYSFTTAREAAAAYLIYSFGPDRDVNNGDSPPYTFYRPYDPTNGTVSTGNIFRSQKTSEGIDYASVLD